MKKATYLFMILMFALIGSAFGKDFTGKVTIGAWDGKDSAGVLEGSLPCTIKLFNAVDNTLLTSATVNGPVTNFVMPDFKITVADNTTYSFSCYATVVDSVGNSSAKSTATTPVSLVGTDTHSPAGINTINVNFTSP